MPKLHRNNEKFFRGLGSKGIISFSEYLFLLTILIKPQSGFKIAFAMLDQDGSETVDKEEFKVLETVFRLFPDINSFPITSPPLLACQGVP